MKILSLTQRRQHGSVLMVTLFMVGLIGFFLYAYLYSARTQRILVARSQAWNAALGLAEAGAEEALAQLNPGAPSPTIDRSANGWGGPVGGLYGPMARTLTDGNYSVVINDDTWPIIYATGYVAVASIPATLARTIKVTTTNSPLFTVAMAAVYNIDLKGNNVGTDSFNSAISTLSSNGFYSPAYTSTNGDIASIQGLVNVGNANVNGSVLLGPTASDSLSKNGFITGGVSNDFNVDFESVVVPQTNWLPAISTNLTIDGISYQYVFPSLPLSTGVPAYYSISGLSGNVYIGTNQNVTLLLSGSASPNNIRVAGTGTNSGDLVLYMDGPSFTLGGNDSVDGGNAANLTYYGTTNNTQISFNGNASFTGTIYAPQADFKLGGGGINTYDFVGASVTRSVTMNGHFNFHYDENLLRAGPRKGFVAASWQEL
jgi:Tfp pilus assembly protein PilX